MVNSSVLKNMAELHEATTLHSQSVQSYPDIIISKAWNQPPYLQHLKTLKYCTNQIIPCNLQTVCPQFPRTRPEE
jgi:hypothetical protein